jgi:hypothetical protein
VSDDAPIAELRQTSAGARAADQPDDEARVVEPAALEAAASRLLNDVAERIRSIDTAAGPGLEATLRDPDLGLVRLVVSGLPGETVQATLTAESAEAASALRAAIEQHRSVDGLSGIALQVRQDLPTPITRHSSTGLDVRPDAGSGNARQAFGGAGTPGDGRRGTGQADAVPTPLPIRSPRPVSPTTNRLLPDRLGRAVDRIA